MEPMLLSLSIKVFDVGVGGHKQLEHSKSDW